MGDLGLILDWDISWRREWQPHSGILACRIAWTEEPGGIQSMRLQEELDMIEGLTFSLHTSQGCIHEH